MSCEFLQSRDARGLLTAVSAFGGSQPADPSRLIAWRYLVHGLKRILIPVLLLSMVGGTAATAQNSKGPTRRDPLVLVVAQTFKKIKVGNGFAIGDGSLIVTAYHTVFELSQRGQHRMPGSPAVFSPYLGNACPAEIVVADQRLDLAILRTNWKGHPAFRIADTGTLLATKRIEIVGLPKILFNLSHIAQTPPADFLPPSQQVLPVDFVAVREGEPVFLALSRIGELKPGWSGSAMLIPGTDVVAGCFTELTRRHYGMASGTVVAQGPAVTQVRHLLTGSGLGDSLEASEDVLPRPPDARKAFLVSLQMLSHLIKDEPEPALEQAQAFTALRPDCSFAYRISAYAAAKLKQLDLAEQLYQEAMRAAPDEPSITLRYVQYLGLHGRGDEALEHLEALWGTGKMRPELGLFFFNILAPRGEFARCAELTEEVLKENPQNAYLWANLGVCQTRLEDPESAVSSYARAAELFPEAGRLQLLSALALERLGRIDEAEEQFRRLVELQPKRPALPFRLALFLARHRPDSSEEAIKEAETALGLPQEKGLPEKTIEDFIKAVREGTFNGEAEPTTPGEEPTVPLDHGPEP